jgi:asparagine synthase (glutamine-hydrolysing)
MCGIAGVLYADPHRIAARDLLDGMACRIAHRGPDASSVWSAPGVGLVHARLSIIDLVTGDQPIGNEDGSIQVVFNGEIYNYRALRQQLLANGHRLRTNSDTEVLVHLYEDFGDTFVTRLRGMFAFALWDGRRRRLLLGRDRLGIKPLYIYRDREQLLFASELKAILANPSVSREIDDRALNEYLAFSTTIGARSIFRDITKLLPAHVVAAESGRLEQAPQRYWSLRCGIRRDLDVVEWRDAVHAKIEEAVDAHLVADVPVGAFLSGGVDSSIVVACAAKRMARPIQTFSIGFGEARFNELPFAREVARACGTDHVEEIVTPDAVSLMEELSYHYDEPFGDSSAIPTYLVSKLARRSVRVVLSGDGGDEGFGGYSRYLHDVREAAVRRMLPQWLRRTALARVAALWPRSDWLPRPLRAKSWLTNISLDPGHAYANTLSVSTPTLRHDLIAADRRAALRGFAAEDVVAHVYDAWQTDDALAAMTATDIAITLPDDYLVKVDRASMAHGLEVRPPLLDHELIELAMTIPSSLKIRDGGGKWIMKHAFAGELPPSVYRPKQGFDLPVNAWLRGPLRENFAAAVLERNARVGGLIDQEVARKLYDSHLAGWSQHGDLLWCLFALGTWAERYLRTDVPVGHAGRALNPAAPSAPQYDGSVA